MSLASLAALLMDASANTFGMGIILIIWLIVYFRRRHLTPTREAVTGASWSALILSFPLRYLGLLTDFQFGFIIVTTIAAITMLNQRE